MICFAISETLKKLELGNSEARFGGSVKNDAERCSRWLISMFGTQVTNFLLCWPLSGPSFGSMLLISTNNYETQSIRISKKSRSRGAFSSLIDRASASKAEEQHQFSQSRLTQDRAGSAAGTPARRRGRRRRHRDRPSPRPRPRLRLRLRLRLRFVRLWVSSMRHPRAARCCLGTRGGRSMRRTWSRPPTRTGRGRKTTCVR